MNRRQKSNTSLRTKPVMWDLADGRIRAHFNMVQVKLPKHAHTHFELLYLIKGVRRVNLNGRHFEARSGDLLIFRPNDCHAEFPGTKKVSFFAFRFRLDELIDARLEFPVASAIVPIMSLPRQEEFYDLFNRMLDEQNHAGEGSQLLLGAYLVEFIVKLRRAVKETLCQRTGVEQNSIQLRIHNAIRLLEKNLTGDTNIKKIAESVFMSPSYFSHVFKENVSESPKHYLIGKRIIKAKNLLVDTTLTAKEIAVKLGYENQYYFYRQFRQMTGMTAGKYRLLRRRPAKNTGKR